jgi:hypothetical protein
MYKLLLFGYMQLPVSGVNLTEYDGYLDVPYGNIFSDIQVRKASFESRRRGFADLDSDKSGDAWSAYRWNDKYLRPVPRPDAFALYPIGDLNPAYDPINQGFGKRIIRAKRTLNRRIHSITFRMRTSALLALMRIPDMSRTYS